MSVEFQDENPNNAFYKSRQDSLSSSTPTLAGWLMRKGIVKSEKGASVLLVTITVICFALAIFITLYTVGIIPRVSTWGKTPQPIPYAIWQRLPPKIQERTPHLPAPEATPSENSTISE